jgi:di/tricarboxylate transporter
MNPMTITLIILLAALGLLFNPRLRPDLVALLVVISLGLSGVLTSQEAFSGFSRSAVIIILAIFILTEGLQRTGLTEQIGKLLLQISGPRKGRLIVVTMVISAFLSLFMNNIAAASVLFSAVSGAARRAGIRPSLLLMPLAFGTTLGGMATLFTSANIVVSSLLNDGGYQGFGVLDFLPLGIPLVVIGIAYMALWGQRLLPTKTPGQLIAEMDHSDADLKEIYRLHERLIHASVPNGSPLINKPLVESKLRDTFNLNLVAVERDSKLLLRPSPTFQFKEGDVALLEGKLEEIDQELIGSSLVFLPKSETEEADLEKGDSMLVEAALTPRSSLIGQTLRQAHFREKYGLNALAVWRIGRPIRTGISDLALQFGDALLLHGSSEKIQILRGEPGVILLKEDQRDYNINKKKAWLAGLIMVVTLLVSATTHLPVGDVMLGGAIAMILAGILTMDQAYQAVDWKTIFLIAGMLPLGIAMNKSGLASALGQDLGNLLGNSGPTILLLGLVILCVLTTQIMNGPVVAAMFAPLAIGLGQQANLNPRSLAMGVAIAASMAFLTPLGHPVNMLVMGSGGYSFKDFLKVGLPLTLILVIALIILLPVFWPYR